MVLWLNDIVKYPLESKLINFILRLQIKNNLISDLEKGIWWASPSSA